MSKPVFGFSKLSKSEKIDWLVETHFSNQEAARLVLRQYWNTDVQLQRLHDEFIENTVTNYYLPFGIAPNFMINSEVYTIPMAIEESSVVAAASKAAKFWLDRGGIRAKVISTSKNGQVHFMYSGSPEAIKAYFEWVRPKILQDAEPLVENMKKRGGGITSLELRDMTHLIKGYFQLYATFETKDAMGANFINSCLESFANTLKSSTEDYAELGTDQQIEIVMSILSNYVPECLVRAEVSCPVSELNTVKDLPPEEFAQKFVTAVDIAKKDTHRAVTHNKGLMNGVDAVILATGNDFRAVEAGVHAYAARNGQYISLSDAEITNNHFRFYVDLPLAIGTVGGLTRIHPLVKLALELLGNPTGPQLMEIVAAVGLAQNFAAVSSLITTGIQQGHMKMHLLNILNEYQATEDEKSQLIALFKDQAITHGAVTEALEKLRI